MKVYWTEHEPEFLLILDTDGRLFRVPRSPNGWAYRSWYYGPLTGLSAILPPGDAEKIFSDATDGYCVPENYYHEQMELPEKKP